MEYYIGQIFEEMYPPEAAAWCNENNAIITEIEPTDVRRFRIDEVPAPSVEQKKVHVRAIRDQYINNIEWRVSRYRDQVEIGVTPTDDQATYTKILQYMQYLRDYPESGTTWYEQNPQTWEEWSEQ